MKRFIASLPIVRPFIIKLLKTTAFNIYIKNKFTSDKLFLNTYKHKSYWYYASRREEKTMSFFGSNIKKGDTVIEVGGHIGFITQYFSRLVGNNGRVIVFEPGENNLPYIKKNIKGKNNIGKNGGF